MCCDGRVVKATDLKSVGIFPHRFKSCSQRINIIFIDKISQSNQTNSYTNFKHDLHNLTSKLIFTYIYAYYCSNSKN